MVNSGQTAPGRTGSILERLWRLAVSPVTFVVLSLLWCLDLGIGSLLAYWRPDLFGGLDAYPFKVWLELEAPRAWPDSLWVHLLVVLSWLMVASLLLCTVNWFLYRRKRLKGLGEVLVHLGFLLVFAGYVIGAASGARTLGVRLPVEGGTTRVASQDVVLTLRSVRPILSATGEVQGASSDLEVVSRGERAVSPRVQINHPLMAGSTVVYPRGVQQQVEGARLVVPGSGPIELRPGGPVRLPGGTNLELAGILQPDESRDNLQGPGVFVTVRPAGGTPATAYLSTQEGMAAEASIGGEKLVLAELRGPFLAVYDVHYDPGVWFVIGGALLITLGTVWAFVGYLREGAPP
jgi:hypothetical protein